ncbi:trypsin-like serine protease [Moritella sp. F3]|uniref:trypsin-like serine protease n=1 Tax=Moritella sp. F3 TaxID=2718882 RepID=UPI0018E1C501|nr:trypsin-like serine protease [Moritella sp. F3]GIC79707.1 hypothetical protein FMO001_44340 [Moritella sp. F1]GIC84183.1 hypothetical protein FMO003_44630 [Moritella sp. F3]
MKNMNQFGKLALIATIATTSIPAHAVWYGEEVAQAEDFRVFVDGSAGNCGGQIIAGKYVITAMHCIDDNNNRVRQLILDRNNIQGDPQRVDDINLLEATLTRDEYTSDVYFGSNERYGGQLIEVTGSIINPHKVWKYRYGNYADKKQVINDNYGSNFTVNFGADLVILKLKDTVEQQSTSILDVGDITSPHSKIGFLTGWGRDENGSFPNTLHKAKLQLEAMPYSLGDPAGFDNNGGNPVPLADSYYDYPTLRRVDDGNGNLQQSDSGDSGSPVILDGFSLGFVSGKTIAGGDQYGTGITGPAYWINDDQWIPRHIDAVNTVGKVVLEIDESFTNHEWTIPVQSLKIDNVEVNGTANLLSNSNNGFTVNSDCNATLTTGQYCHITLTYNGLNGDGDLILKEGEVAGNLLVINDSLQIPVAVIYPDKTVDPVIPTVPTTPSNEKSGGSFGIYAGLALLIELVRRRIKLS